MPKNSGGETRQTVIFLHIPKTAGNTLNDIMKRQYEPQAVFSLRAQHTQRVDAFKQLPEARKRTIQVLAGHVRFGLHQDLPQPSTYITLLRDPVERVISHYYYVLRRPDHYLHETVTSQNMTLQDYVSSGICSELNNDQTKILAGIEHKIAFGQCPPEMLAMAKHNIHNYFTLVGFTERFDETVILLKQRLGWHMPFYKKNRNVTKNRPLRHEIAKATLALIEHYNTLDLELYQYAHEQFEALLEQQSLYVKSEIRLFKILNPSVSIIASQQARMGSVYRAAKQKIQRFLARSEA